MVVEETFPVVGDGSQGSSCNLRHRFAPQPFHLIDIAEEYATDSDLEYSDFWDAECGSESEEEETSSSGSTLTREGEPLPHLDLRFQKPPSRVPTKSICLATFLCFAGTSLLVFGMLVLSGHLDAKFADRVWPMIIMGFLMFIPGAYHVRIAYYAYKGIPGYSFDDIPEFE